MYKIQFVFLLLFSLFFNTISANEKLKDKSYLSVNHVSDDGLELVLDDGSEWYIKYYSGLWTIAGWGWTEKKEVSNWKKDDRITIQYASINLYEFVLLMTNLSQNEEAWICLKKAPSFEYPSCLWIVDFDISSNRIMTNDGKIWIKTNGGNMNGALLDGPTNTSQNKWQSGDPLTLIGVYGFLNDQNSAILWNHTTNEMDFVYPSE